MPNHYPSGFEHQIGDLVYEVMVDFHKVPANDKFQILTRHTESQLVKPASYLGIEYSDQLIAIQITPREGRTIEVKKAFYAGVADSPAASLDIRKEDIVISLVEVNKENWSFGNGKMQYGSE